MAVLHAIVLALAIGVFGLVPTGIVIFIVALAGIPGGLVWAAGERTSSLALRRGALALAWFCQSYVSLAFVVLVVAALREFLARHQDLPAWPLWIAAFFLANAPATYAMRADVGPRSLQHYVLPLISFATLVGFFAIAAVPKLGAVGWPWVPFQRPTASAIQQSPITASDSAPAAHGLALDYSLQGENARTVLAAVFTMQELSQRMPWNHADTLMARREIDRDINMFAGMKRVALDSVFPGWGRVMFDEWLPAMRNVSQLLNPDSTFKSMHGTLRTTSDEMTSHMRAYDQWMGAHRSQLLEALLQRRVIEAYADSAGSEHHLK